MGIRFRGRAGSGERMTDAIITILAIYAVLTTIVLVKVARDR